MLPSAESRAADSKLWTIRDTHNGWFEIMYRERYERNGVSTMTSWHVIAKVYSLGRAEIVRDALMAAYGGKVYERPRRSLRSLRQVEEG